jgi:hypothetical protein
MMPIAPRAFIPKPTATASRHPKRPPAGPLPKREPSVHPTSLGMAIWSAIPPRKRDSSLADKSRYVPFDAACS